ncbi:MAG: response regulator transcription factor [Clostridia bacterium]|nr:response regulator transcription factor [Clostridia bacterium]
MYKILLVEDDPDIRELICDYFHAKSNNTICIETATDGQTGVEKAYENAYDVLLLDVMLPELSGFEICKEVRRDSDVPILFITARAAQEDMLHGYALGCDDYVVKPFPLAVLYEKVNALIKRSKGLVRQSVFTSGGLTLNPNNGKVLSESVEVTLTAKEYSILRILFENKGAVVSRDTLIRHLWGYDSDIDERIVDSHIKNLRKALGTNSKLIRTVRSRGYVLEESK